MTALLLAYFAGLLTGAAAVGAAWGISRFRALASQVDYLTRQPAPVVHRAAPARPAFPSYEPGLAQHRPAAAPPTRPQPKLRMSWPQLRRKMERAVGLGDPAAQAASNARLVQDTAMRAQAERADELARMSPAQRQRLIDSELGPEILDTVAPSNGRH